MVPHVAVFKPFGKSAGGAVGAPIPVPGGTAPGTPGGYTPLAPYGAIPGALPTPDIVVPGTGVEPGGTEIAGGPVNPPAPGGTLPYP